MWVNRKRLIATETSTAPMPAHIAAPLPVHITKKCPTRVSRAACNAASLCCGLTCSAFLSEALAVPTTMLAGSAGLSKDAACAILVATPSAILRNTEPAYLGDIHTCIIDEADMLLDGASPLPVSHAHTQLLSCLDPLHGLGCHICIHIHIHVYLRIFICIYICVYIYIQAGL